MRDDDRYRLADRLLGGKSEKPLRASVPAEDHAIEILRQDGVVGRLDNGLIVVGCEIVIVCAWCVRRPARSDAELPGWPICFKTGFLAGARSPNLHRCSHSRECSQIWIWPTRAKPSYAVCPGLSTPLGGLRFLLHAHRATWSRKPGARRTNSAGGHAPKELARRAAPRTRRDACGLPRRFLGGLALDGRAFGRVSLDQGLGGQPMALRLAFGASFLQPQEIGELADAVVLGRSWSSPTLAGRARGVSLTCAAAFLAAADRLAGDRAADAAPPIRPPLCAAGWPVDLPRPDPPARFPPPSSLLTVAQARRSASFSETPRLS